jgi:MoaA/NifB/PqqE/SkfB family radical SAM enzyme
MKMKAADLIQTNEQLQKGIEVGNLYTKMKIFHYKEKIDSLPIKVSGVKSPIHIRIKPTNVCNHNCWYCAYRADHMQLGKDMVVRDKIPHDKMMEIIDDLAEMGTQAVTFSGGGEPFLYPYLVETVKKIIENNISFAALTNGIRLSGEVAELFAHNGTWVRISMDGWDDESYMKYRGCGDGEYTKIIKNIKSFKKLNGKCLLGINLIIDKSNAKYVRNQLKFFKSLGVNSAKVGAAVVSNDSIENNKYHNTFFSETKKSIDQAKDEFEDASFEIFDAYHKLDENFDKDYSWCPYMQINPVIGADLNIYPCHDKAYNLENGLLGSIKNQRFKDFWFSDKDNYFKIVPSRDCNHHCVVNIKNALILEYLEADKDHLGFV